MEQLFFFIPLFVFFAIAGAIVWGVSLYEKKRSREVRDYGTQLGFEPLQVLPGELDGFISRTKLMNMGRRRQSRNVLRREVPPTDLVLFDYQYTIGSGKHSRTVRQTVAAFRSARIQAPVMQLRPENWLSKVGQVFGSQDIDFAESPEFSRRFVLQGPDETEIRRYFTPERLEAIAKYDKLCFEMQPGCAFIWFDYKRTPPAELRQFFEKVFEIYSILCADAE